MNYFAYKANMELGQAYLDMMTRVHEDGLSFIGPEIRDWQTSVAFQKFHTTQQLDGTDGLNLRIFDNMRSDDRVRRIYFYFLLSFLIVFVSLFSELSLGLGCI